MRAAGIFVAIAAAGALLSCARRDVVAKQPETMMADVAEPSANVTPPGLVAAPDGPRQAVAPAVAPRIAYSYSREYRLAGERLPSVQAAHIRLCDRLGQARCRIITMERASASADYANGSLSLQVDARIARAFGAALDRTVAGGGGTIAGSGIQAEDLSKQMVDTDARIRAKQALAQRLIALIASRSAKVGELVEAERALSTAQEELDAARGWMAEMQARVATSRYDLRYLADAPDGGALEPIRVAVVESGRSFAASLGTLIAFVVMALPWAALLALLVWLLRRRGWRPRLRLWRRAPPEP